MTGAAAGYTFVPFFRRGLAGDVDEPDDPADLTTGRASVTISLTAGWADSAGTPGAPVRVPRRVGLIGPGDVAGLRPGAVLRCHPPDGAREASPGELAYVEFYDEDLPWRYTPAAAVTVRIGTGTTAVDAPRLRPWLCLLVLQDDEFTLVRRATGTAVVTVADGVPLPPADQSWAWAHAQLAGAVPDATQAGPHADQDPDAALSRILSPVRLVAGKAYTAFVVPAFETGRLVGLGLDASTTPARQASWGAGRADRRFPVYHSWHFATGTEAGFEALVRRLRARTVGEDFGSREMSVDGSALGVALPATVRLEGALRPHGAPRAGYPNEVPGPTGVAALQAGLDTAGLSVLPGALVGDDPIVSPPLYGARHAGVVVLRDVADDDPVGWVRELNLDPRNRAAAGLGAQVVRDGQEDLMVRAWAQVGHLREANQRLREAELALEAASTAFTKHVEGTSAARLLMLTAGAHGGLAAPAGATGSLVGEPVPSVLAAVRASRIPTAAVEDPAFRALTRPHRPLVRQVAAASATPAGTGSAGADVLGFQLGLVERLDLDAGHADAVSAAPPVPASPVSVSVGDLDSATAVAAARITTHESEPKRVLLELLADELTVTGGGAPPALPATAADLTTALGPRITAWRAAHPGRGADADRVAVLAAAITEVAEDGTGVRVALDATRFAEAFGAKIAGKSYQGVLVSSAAPPPDGKIAMMSSADGAAELHDGVMALSTDLANRLQDVPPPAGALGDVAGVADAVIAGMAPAQAIYRRVAAGLPGLADHLAAQAAIAGRRLRPVLAHPSFDDPTVEALEALSQDYVLPNIAALPSDTITMMEPNRRFIESYLAGLNTEMGRELLWREFPTDERGTYFRVFWDRRDAADLDASTTTDIAPLPEWVSRLGSNAPAGAGTTTSPLVLVIRSDLLVRFPHTVVTAHRAVWTGQPAQGRRTLDPTAAPLAPLFTATMAPDVTLVAFALDEGAARGHVPTGSGDTTPADPGYFFVLAERPGQPTFGLDLGEPDTYATWDDLAWARLAPAGSDLPAYLDITTAVPTPADPMGSLWPATSADLASILLRSPVMYARHADDLLPREPPP